jgi:hypothetical protein
VAIRERAQRGTETGVVVIEHAARTMHEQRHRRVDDVLTRRAPVHETRGLGVDRTHLRGQRLDERDRDGRRGSGRLRHLRRVEALDLGGHGDRVGSFDRDHAALRLRSGEARLDIQQRLKHRGVVEDRRQRRGGGQRVEQMSGHQVTRRRRRFRRVPAA